MLLDSGVGGTLNDVESNDASRESAVAGCRKVLGKKAVSFDAESKLHDRLVHCAPFKRSAA